MQLSGFSLFLTFIIVFLCHPTFCSYVSLTLDIAPGVRECLHQFIAEKTEYEVEYQVIEGGDLDVNFMIQSPTNAIISVPDIRKTTEVHKLQATETGDFAFCIDNSFSHFANKLVYFELFVGDDDGSDEEHSLSNAVADADFEYKLEDFKDNIERIHDNLQKSFQVQKLFSAVESRDRGLVEFNFERVNFWSTIQVVVMVTAAAVNVFAIRSFFDEKRATSAATKLRT